jgi:hypothetical protein
MLSKIAIHVPFVFVNTWSALVLLGSGLNLMTGFK